MIAILHNIRSIHNTGSMFRTADGAGVQKIYLTGYTASPLDKFGRAVPQFTKVSLGAEDFVEWERSSNIKNQISKLKKQGYKIFAVEQSKKSVPYDSLLASRYELIAIVVGNEVKGLSPAILKQCDKILEIPMRGVMVRQAHHPRQTGRGKESLNVSVAFGIATYELSKKFKVKSKR